MRKYVFSLLFVLLLAGCDFEVPGADERFGMQNFVSAISLIELHKTRNGVYPNTLAELDFLGDWDGIWLSAVKYEKNDDGYNLYLERGWAGKPSLEFPERFKQGLGIKETNIKWVKN
tara:strand:- start:2936 stop:3286 length:351 start_codon:yes stop_codon:yes gene_type:complete